jgi:hypothetical protein
MPHSAQSNIEVREMPNPRNDDGKDAYRVIGTKGDATRSLVLCGPAPIYPSGDGLRIEIRTEDDASTAEVPSYASITSIVLPWSDVASLSDNLNRKCYRVAVAKLKERTR